MDLAKELTERGFVHQHSADLATIFNSTKRTVYLGIDPTASSMHVGHLVPYMMLNHIMNAGHQVIVVMGGGTALIGDPSFKEQERDIADVETIAAYAKGLEANVRKITTSDTVRFVNNYDWLSKLGAIEFLRDVGKHFTVNNMVKKESVARRFESEQGISYTEFSYSLLQAYDFYHLHQEYGCDVQIGGSDQWGNVIAGIDFIRRKTSNEVFALTMPLVIDKVSGKKFGKSEGNAVWLDPELTSPFAFYQFWLNTNDESVIEYLKLFTFVPLSEIADIEQEHSMDPGQRIAQRRLALEVTSFVHGEETALSVARISATLFGEVALTELTSDELATLEANAPLTEVSDQTPLVDILVSAALASSKREARTFIESGAVQINGEKVTDLSLVVAKTTHGPLLLVKRGKKNLSLVRVV